MAPAVRNATLAQEDTDNLAINDTFFNRIFTRLALATVGRLHQSDGLCTPISKHMIVKAGRRLDLTEAATMKFVAEHTSIPVPRVYCSFRHKDRVFILMERIQGDDIPAAWRRLPEAGRERVLSHLKALIEQLRALKPASGTGVESCFGGSLYDSRMKNAPRFGPFQTIQDFHFWLREKLRPADFPDKEKDQDWLDIIKMAEMQDASWPPPVFTHADLNPFNILVREDKVVGIIDWEFAGWYPHYWEYTSAWYGNLVRTGWQDVLDKFLEPLPVELEMERVRNKWWGEF